MVGSCFDLLHFVKVWQLPCFRFTLSVGVMEEASSCSFFFFGVGKEWKEGVTECYGGAVISQSSHRAQGDRWQVGNGAGSSLPPIYLFAFFQPVLIPKQLQQTLLLVPIALAVTVFCYSMFILCCLGVHMSFNLLSQAAEKDKDADWDKGVSFLREERLHQYLCLYKESKQEDRHVLCF